MLEEHAKELGVVKRDSKLQISALIWAFVFVALCLRLVVAITNFERGDNPGCEALKL